ncbi:hypothetical protein RCO48_17110 [Peribacillus frigoritolerans]|nr:hypothetical protein [Peribacillus frigoritolerans]
MQGSVFSLTGALIVLESYSELKKKSIVLIEDEKQTRVTKMKQNIWEKEYRNVDSLWGFKPNGILSQYVEMLPENGEVLDIGIGEGRNALFFRCTRICC